MLRVSYMYLLLVFIVHLIAWIVCDWFRSDYFAFTQLKHKIANRSLSLWSRWQKDALLHLRNAKAVGILEFLKDNVKSEDVALTTAYTALNGASLRQVGLYLFFIKFGTHRRTTLINNYSYSFICISKNTYSVAKAIRRSGDKYPDYVHRHWGE